MTTSAVLGTSTNSLKYQNNRTGLQFAHAFDEAQHCLAVRGRIANLYWMYGGKRFRNACKFVHEFVENIVAEAIKQKENKPPGDHSAKEGYLFIDALIRETKDVKVIRDQLVNVLLAGRDTTACLLSWTL